MPAVGLETRTRCRAEDARGMTLLELMAVASIIAVLMGLGVGFLRRSDGMPEARSAIVGALRAAALDARTRGLPTEVAIEPADDERLARVVARGLDPAVLITFESGQQFAYAGIEPTYGGEDVPAGRIGHGRKAGERSAALRLPFAADVADLGTGFAIRIDVLLQQRAAGRLLRLGRAVDVQCDDQARPQVRIVSEGDKGRPGAAVNLQSVIGLPLLQWATIEIGHDGYRAWLAIDGREVAAANLRNDVLQQKGDQLEVLPAEEPLPAVVDELQVFAYAMLPAVTLPDSIAVTAPVRIAFDSLGEPIAPPEIKLEVVAEKRTETLVVGPGGVLQ